MSPPALEQAPMQNLVYSQKYQESHLWRTDCCKLSQQGNSCLFLRNSPTQFPLKKYASFPIVNNFVYSTLVYTSAATKQKLITRSGNGNKKKKTTVLLLFSMYETPFFPRCAPGTLSTEKVISLLIKTAASSSVCDLENSQTTKTCLLL